MAAELTLFSIPRSFEGHVALIQRNALAAWRRLAPDVEIVLFGADAGVREAAAEFGAAHEPTVGLSDSGTPLVSDAFARAAARSRRPLLMFSNADMLYDETIVAAARLMAQRQRFLLSGRRTDSDVTTDLTALSHTEWAGVLGRSRAGDPLHGPAGMDYFLFPREMPLSFPPMAVGREGWDSWLVWHCRTERIPVIDATAAVTAVHQNHGYAASGLGQRHRYGPERDMNIRAGGGLSRMFTLREATLHLKDGRLVPPPLGRRVLAALAPMAAYQQLLGFSRTIRGWAATGR